MVRLFKEADKNGDGFLDPDERISFLAKLMAAAGKSTDDIEKVLISG